MHPSGPDLRSLLSPLRISALVLACLCAGGAVRAETPPRRLTDYVLDSWRMTDGLPQESITAILQSRTGFLWLGTLDGLVRFDGVRFEVIDLIRRGGMDGNMVLALAEAPDGSLWIGSRDGLAHYRDGKFRAHTTAHGLRDPFVRSVTVASDGTVWAGTRAGGLNRFAGGRWSSLTTADGLPSDDVRAVLVARNGTVWAATTGGLCRVEAGRVSRVRLPGVSRPVPVLSLHEDREGRVWVGTDDGVWAIPPGHHVPSLESRVLGGRQVRALLRHPDGALWAATTTGLAKIVGTEAWVVTRREGLNQDHVRALAVDREGSLWVGSDGTGLNRLRRGSVVMVTSEKGPEADILMSVYQDAAGTMWLASNCGGLVRRQGADVRAFTARDGLPDNCVRALAGAPDGSLWVGTEQGLAHVTGSRITRPVVPALVGRPVVSLAATRDGLVWAGTDNGLIRLSGTDAALLTTRDGLPGNDVRALLEGRDGSLWLGTLGGGLARLKDGRFTCYTRREGLSSNNVLDLQEDADGTLWIGTNGGGLNRFRDGRFTHFTTANGLFSNGVFRVLDDGRGGLWMGANRGIFRVARHELEEVARGARRAVTCRTFQAADGLRSGSVMGGIQPAGWRDREGRLWFPTIAGAAVIDPAHLVANTTPPPVHIERLVADREDQANAAVPRLPAGSRQVEIHYTAPSFVASEKVMFRYRLEPFADDWVEAGTRRAAYFTNLAPGRYRFQVQACNNDGVWNWQGTSMEFVVLPRFHQTRTFFAGCVVLLVAAGWGATWARTRRLRLRQRELARQVDEALAEIKVLSGLLPICASCKRIKDEGGDWKVMEDYIHQHSQATFSHGICPECMRKLYPAFAKEAYDEK